jgi:hypothetical protein
MALLLQDKAQKLKEAFAILTQGVEMVHHDSSSGKKTTQRKIVWMVRNLSLTDSSRLYNKICY